MTSRPRGRRPQSGGRATGWALAGAAATTAANFGIAVVVALAGSDFAGWFFAATAVVSILGNTSALGSMTALQYFMPQALDDAEGANPRGLLLVALRPVGLAGVATAAALVILARPLAHVVAGDDAAQVATMLRIMSPGVVAWALTVALLGATRSLGTMTATAVVNQVGKPLAQLAAIVAAVTFFDGDAATAAVAAAWTAPIVVSAAAAAAWVVHLGGLEGRPTSVVDSARFWAYARPRAVSTGLQIALERIDVLLVSALAGPAAAGVYGTLTRYVTAGNYLVFSIAQATTPTLRRAIAAERFDEAARLLRRATGWMVLVTWPYLFLLATKAEPLARLLNPDFATGANALAVLAVVVAINAASGPIDATLLMLGRSGASMMASVAALTVDVALAIVLVPRFGLTGAALAWGGAVAVANGSATVLVSRTAGLRAPGRAAAVAAALAAFAVLPAGFATPSTFGGLVLTAAIAGAVLVAGALRFGPVLGLPTIGAGPQGAKRVTAAAKASAAASEES